MSDRALTVMIGLPESGKTTYLAALWHVVNRGGVALELDHLEGDQSYLNRVCDEWRKCVPTVRTSRAAETEVGMFLRSQQGDVIELRIPDVSGESYNDFWEHRGWTQRFDAVVSASTAIMLFIHAGNLRQPEFLDELAMLAGDEDDTEPSQDQAVAWSPSEAADQVKLVELLQFIRERANRVIPIAVVISAWDLVPTIDHQDPDGWFANRVPLLAQYLDVHSDVLPKRVWGVSAQGGDLTVESKRLSLRDVEPAQRVRVLDSTGETETHDVTGPLVWLLEQPA